MSRIPGGERADATRQAPDPTSVRDTWARLAAGPLLALVVYVSLAGVSSGEVAPGDAPALGASGRATAALAVLMATWWITEALPLAATALVPLALFPLCGVASVGDAAAPYAHPLIFLFLGGFLIARAVERWGLHRRVALWTVLGVGTRPTRLVGGFMLASAFVSMWISNTATTVMMLPIGMSVMALAEERMGAMRLGNFGTALMLGIAYGATIGGTATLVGSPPNAFLAGFLSSTHGIDVGFGRWMLIGVPLVVVFLPVAWLLLTRVLYPPPRDDLVGGRRVIHDELRALGRMSRGEKIVAVIFCATALGWITREPLTNVAWVQRTMPALARLDDAGIAILAALALFATPVEPRRRIFTLDWDSAQRLPWGVLLLFGGGLSLAAAFRSTGLDVWISGPARALADAPAAVLVAFAVILIVFLTELASNTATAATFLPVLSGVALGAGLPPTLLVVPAALAASCAFMMPVATPPNAIVFGSRHVRIGQMVRAGLLLNVASIVLINLLAHSVVVWVLGGG